MSSSRRGDARAHRRRAARRRAAGPRPRTSATPGQPRQPRARYVPTRSALSIRPSATIASSTASAAAATGGEPPKVVAWSPGAKPSSTARATSAPIGRPEPRPLASVTASGSTPSRRNASQAPQRPMPVCTSSQISSASLGVAQLARRRQEAGVQRVHAALALHRLDQHGGGARADGGPQGVEVVGRHVREARRQRLERLLLRSRPGGRQRAVRAAVERALEADDLVLVRPAARPAAAARELDRRLVRLGAGVAEERAAVAGRSAREPLGERDRRAPTSRGSRRGRAPPAGPRAPDRRRVAVTEGHDREAGDEVEVLAALVVEQRACPRRARRRWAAAGTSAARRRRRGRRAAVRSMSTLMPVTTVPAPIRTRPHARPRARCAARLELRQHAAVDAGRRDALDLRDDRAVGVEHAGHVGEEHELVGAHGRRHGRGDVVGVDVEVARRRAVARERRDQRHPPRAQAASSGAVSTRSMRPTRPSSCTREPTSASPRSELRGLAARLAQRVGELVGHARQRRAGAGQDRQVGDPAAADEARLDAAAAHQLRDLRAAAVDDREPPALAQRERLGERGQGVAARAWRRGITSCTPRSCGRTRSRDRSPR